MVICRISPRSRPRVLSVSGGMKMQALQGAAFLGWHTLTRHAKKHTATATKQEQLNLRRSTEFDRCAYSGEESEFHLFFVGFLSQMLERDGKGVLGGGITYAYALMNLTNTLTSHATSLAKPIKEPSQGRGGLKNLVV